MSDLWSEAQSCVWIRTRDLLTVEKLEPGEAASLVLADEVAHGAFEARQCLQAAIAGGRFKPRDDEMFQRDAIIGHWPAPRSVLGAGRVPLGRLIERGALHAGAEDNWVWFLGRHDVTVSGVDASGQHMTIARAALAKSSLTIKGDSLMLGAVHWSRVIVALVARPPMTKASPPGPTLRGSLILGAPEPASPSTYGKKRPAGAKPNKLQVAVAWLCEKHPKGPPAGIKNSALLHDMHKDTGVAISEKHLRRAMQVLGQNTAK